MAQTFIVEQLPPDVLDHDVGSGGAALDARLDGSSWLGYANVGGACLLPTCFPIAGGDGRNRTTIDARRTGDSTGGYEKLSVDRPSRCRLGYAARRSPQIAGLVHRVGSCNQRRRVASVPHGIGAVRRCGVVGHRRGVDVVQAPSEPADRRGN